MNFSEQLMTDNKRYRVGALIIAFALSFGSANATPESDRLVDQGNALITNSKFKEAVQVLTKAIALNSKDATAYDDRASAFYSLNKFNEAIADENESLKIDDKNFLAHLNRGSAYLANHDYKSAIADFSRAHEIYPGNAAALTNLAIALHESGNKSESSERFKQARDLYVKAGRTKDAKEVEALAQKYSVHVN